MLIYLVAPDETEPAGSFIANRTPEQQGMRLPRTGRALKAGSGTRGRGSAA